MSIRKERQSRTITGDWQKECASLLNEFQTGTVDRRRFLVAITALLSMTVTHPVLAVEGAREGSTKTEGENATDFSEDPWLTFAAMQDHLFPTSEDAPGANEINATRYLRNVLAETHMDQDDREFILNGVSWLNDISKKDKKVVFAALDDNQREEVLRQIEKTRAGERWIALVLLYIFEALLCDPVYGGNPGEIGWTWLQHQPGFPRPPADQTYQKL
jgi:gluconate 2-dehydrogenase gamma chain